MPLIRIFAGLSNLPHHFSSKRQDFSSSCAASTLLFPARRFATSFIALEFLRLRSGLCPSCLCNVANRGDRRHQVLRTLERQRKSAELVSRSDVFDSQPSTS